MNEVAAVSAVLLVVRLALGLAMAAHGAQKLWGWFGGYGLKGTGGFFEGMGFRPGTLFALAAGVGEVASGVFVALGLFGPIGPALMVSVMIVAAITVHATHGFFASGNGIELPFLYTAGALVLAFVGPGAFSVDTLVGLDGLWSPAMSAVALATGILGALATLLARRPAPAIAASAR